MYLHTKCPQIIIIFNKQIYCPNKTNYPHKMNKNSNIHLTNHIQ